MTYLLHFQRLKGKQMWLLPIHRIVPGRLSIIRIAVGDREPMRFTHAQYWEARATAAKLSEELAFRSIPGQVTVHLQPHD